MQARTWIMVGLLAASTVAVRSAWNADDVPPAPPVPAPHRHAPALDDHNPHLAYAAPSPQLPPEPSVTTPKVVTPEAERILEALRAADVVDDGPALEPDEPGTGSALAGLGGKVHDIQSGEELAGVTVIASSAASAQTQAAITDEHGDYRFTDLPPGEYVVTFYYAELTVERPGMVLEAGTTRRLPLVLDTGEHPPTIAFTSTVQGITIDTSYLTIPIPGRTFEAALGGPVASQGDDLDISFEGVTGMEDSYE